jgi:hypothetical protein
VPGDDGSAKGAQYMNRFFGGNPAGVIVRLAVISFAVGVLLAFLGVSPFEIIDGLTDLFYRIYDMGFDAVEWMIRYLILGAVIVVPIWLIMRLWSVLTGSRSKSAKRQPPDQR